jgi:hypothetical protein
VVRFLVFRNHWNPGFIFRTSFDWDSSFLQPVVDTMTSRYDSALISYYGGADKLKSAACYTIYSSWRNDSHCSSAEEQSIVKRQSPERAPVCNKCTPPCALNCMFCVLERNRRTSSWICNYFIILAWRLRQSW